jgi:hypothetical protein
VADTGLSENAQSKVDWIRFLVGIRHLSLVSDSSIFVQQQQQQSKVDLIGLDF